jgi:hypothetical protein
MAQAYLWFDLAARAFLAGADRDDAIRRRDRVAAKMTPEEIGKAKKLVDDWKPKPAQ